MLARCLTALLVMSIVASPARAQEQSRARTFVQLGLGAAFGMGGEYRYRNSPSAQLTAGLQPDRNRPLMFALHAGTLNLNEGDDFCTVSRHGGCLRNYPIGSILAATAGARFRSPATAGVELQAGYAHVTGLDLEGGGNGLLLSATLGDVPGHYFGPGMTVQDVLLRQRGILLHSIQMRLDLRLW